MDALALFTWYYAIGSYRNAIPTGPVTERGRPMFLLIWTFYLYSSTFVHMIVAAVASADIGNMVTCLRLHLFFAGGV